MKHCLAKVKQWHNVIGQDLDLVVPHMKNQLNVLRVSNNACRPVTENKWLNAQFVQIHRAACQQYTSDRVTDWDF